MFVGSLNTKYRPVRTKEDELHLPTDESLLTIRIQKMNRIAQSYISTHLEFDWKIISEVAANTKRKTNTKTNIFCISCTWMLYIKIPLWTNPYWQILIDESLYPSHLELFVYLQAGFYKRTRWIALLQSSYKSAHLLKLIYPYWKISNDKFRLTNP